VTQEGIDRETFRQRFGEDLLAIHPETIARYEKHGLLYVDDAVVPVIERIFVEIPPANVDVAVVVAVK